MAKSRDAVFTDVQVEAIKAIIGSSIVGVGDKMRYSSTPTLNDTNDIPNWGAVLGLVSGGLSPLEFNGSDLLGTEGDYYLPFTLAAGEVTIVMLITYDDQPNQIIFPQYSFDDEAILGFMSKDNVIEIKVWATGANIAPPEIPAPIFTLQPVANISILQGQTLTLTSNASNTTTYQWVKDGSDLVGQTSSTLTVTDFNNTKSGTYYVKAIGAGGVANSTNSIAVNDVGVIISNQTAQDLEGESYTPVVLTATDGTDVININSGSNGRLRSSVTITISGYGSTLLTAQNGLGENTNLADSSQAFNAPISSPLSIYHRAGGTGTCYDIQVPNTELSQGGQVLYATIKRPLSSITSSPYYTYNSFLGPDPSVTIFSFCSEITPTFKYGPSGSAVTVAGINITTGGSCSNDSECNI